MWAEKVEFLRKLRNGLGKMDEQEAAAGFSSWQEAVAPRDDPMSKALKHLLNKELSRAWVAWHAQWEEKRAKMESGAPQPWACSEPSAFNGIRRMA